MRSETGVISGPEKALIHSAEAHCLGMILESESLCHQHSSNVQCEIDHNPGFSVLCSGNSQYATLQGPSMKRASPLENLPSRAVPTNTIRFLQCQNIRKGLRCTRKHQLCVVRCGHGPEIVPRVYTTRRCHDYILTSLMLAPLSQPLKG